MNLLATILGGGMSSRLFIQVRERRGLCYYISTGGEFYHDCGNFVTQAGVTNNLNKIKEAIKTILAQSYLGLVDIMRQRNTLKSQLN